MRVLSRSEQRHLFKMMCRGSGVTDIVEVTDISPNTVRRYYWRFGEALSALHDCEIRGLSTTRIQCDETWSFVYAKRLANVAPQSKKAPPADQLGEFYTWTALDPDTKLFIAWHVGNRGVEAGLAFFEDVAGRIVGKVQITTDAHIVYPNVVDDTFGTRAGHVVLKKKMKGHWNRETGDSNAIVYGITKKARNQSKVDLALASTSHIERLHGSIRSLNGRFVRKTYGFSKKLENHIYSHAIFGFYYNFMRPHRAFKRAERHWTPAMKAGITSKIWTPDYVLDLVDDYWTTKHTRDSQEPIATPEFALLPIGGASTKPYFVMYSPKRRDAKIHKGACRNCRHGIGRADGAGLNHWYDFDDVETARHCAKTLAPDHFSDCAMCMKGYYRNTRRRM